MERLSPKQKQTVAAKKEREGEKTSMCVSGVVWRENTLRIRKRSADGRERERERVVSRCKAATRAHSRDGEEGREQEMKPVVFF